MDSGAVGTPVLAKAAAFTGLIGTGIAGAMIMSAVEPPKDKKSLFLHALVAAVMSFVFGPIVVRVLDHYATWVDLTAVEPAEYFEWSAPVYFIIGALGWGLVGALLKLRDLIRDRAAEKVAEKIGIGDKS